MIGRVDIVVTAAICSTEVVITVLFELLVVGLSVTTVVKLGSDFVEVNGSDAVAVSCSA